MDEVEFAASGSAYQALDADMPRRGRKPKAIENIFIVEYCGPAKNR